eukprot:jgi/Chlat1/2412/Chrsp17S02822
MASAVSMAACCWAAPVHGVTALRFQSGAGASTSSCGCTATTTSGSPWLRGAALRPGLHHALKLSRRGSVHRSRHSPSHRQRVVAAALEHADGGALETAGSRFPVLVVGGGGREHALAWAMSKSPQCSHVYCAPGNAGTERGKGMRLALIVCTSSSEANAGAEVTSEAGLDVLSGPAVAEFCRSRGIGLVVVGPEAPLVAGLVDHLIGEGIKAFGPTKAAAALEGSKVFMKELCMKYSIPTAKYERFTDAAEAKAYIEKEGAPIVGVVVATSVQEACAAVDAMLGPQGQFGEAGAAIVVEEFLEGEEASFFAITDGKHALALDSAQDHKRVGDGDTGPNTGGMGAYSPAPLVTPELAAIVMDTIINPTVAAMAAEGCPFVGVLYAGLMVDEQGGPLMMRLQSDPLPLFLACCSGTLSSLPATALRWSPEPALCVVLASRGYPGRYQTGTRIEGVEKAETVPGVKVFHAGTARNAEGELVSAGGRVLGVTATGMDVADAQARAYRAVDRISWPEGFCRRDIGYRAVERTVDAKDSSQQAATAGAS